MIELQKSIDIQKEIDDIFILLSYSLVLQDWQPESIPFEQRRGYNIGALLVNPDNEVVHYGLNCINSTDNATQHGEVRAIMGYLAREGGFNLSGFTIYASLEPCIMCAGMITMTAVKRVVFGQNDVKYSKAFERLAFDTQAYGGFPPYPRTVTAEASDLSFRKRLDEAYQEYLRMSEEKFLAKFLTTPQAREIFEDAHRAFLDFKVRRQENEGVYESAASFFRIVVEDLAGE